VTDPERAGSGLRRRAGQARAVPRAPRFVHLLPGHLRAAIDAHERELLELLKDTPGPFRQRQGRTRR
jgi:hypothetical protein